MDKKPASSRRRTLLFSNFGVIFVVALFVVFSILFNRDSTTQTIPYGKFRQMLQAPGVTFRNVKVGRQEIRGEITTQDRVTGPEGNDTVQNRSYTFRTSRLGVEKDDQLLPMLAAKVPDFEAEAEDSPLKGALSFVGWLLA